MANVHTRNSAVWFAPRATHARLETNPKSLWHTVATLDDVPISACAGQHLVDTENMEGVYPNTQVERILSRRLGDVFVGADTSGFECFTRYLFVLVRDEMRAEWEFVNRGAFTSQVENANLHYSLKWVWGAIYFGAPWSLEHHGYTSTLDMACSCSSGSSERDGDPFRLVLMSKRRTTSLAPL